MMTNTALFLINSALLGAGLSVDAFSVSVADGLAESGGNRGRLIAAPVVFALFQGLMPMLGYLLVHDAVETFGPLETAMPWIACGILMLLGVRMVIGRGTAGSAETALTFRTLIMQGIATSIDALSVGFVISGYDLSAAAVCSAVISAVTFCLCTAGAFMGRKAGSLLARRASLAGGILLMLVASEFALSALI